MSELRILDLFSGIGGMRAGFAGCGYTVFASEIDKFARETYQANVPPTHMMAGDIRQVSSSDIPDGDVLLGGFPCQPFSHAGLAKKRSLGKPSGFLDKVSGTLFFEIARILADKQPTAFLLENVRGLLSHNHGETFQTILHILQEELGYEVHWKVIDANYFVPQHRERVYIVGFKGCTSFSFDDFITPSVMPRLASVLFETCGVGESFACDGVDYYDYVTSQVNPKYTISDRMWRYLQEYKQHNRATGRGFGYTLVTPDMQARTLSARYGKDGSEILVSQDGKNPRRLTPRECARLMGFSDRFVIPVSDAQAYKQFGNSVVVSVIREIARIMMPHVQRLKNTKAEGR